MQADVYDANCKCTRAVVWETSYWLQGSLAVAVCALASKSVQGCKSCVGCWSVFAGLGQAYLYQSKWKLGLGSYS